ncbi:MAG: Vitamin B12 import ATP-binding protein BtuD [Phycisphaerae bacterium]|nr:Vitamin B12 import ATP-binding protein BtuD [Phycisphaerae bacterium]
MSTIPVISLVGVSKVFRDFWHRARVKAVSDLTLDVQPGEIFGLLGPNGSGKSTSIKMILGLLHPTRGRVSVFGKPPDDVATKSRIGYLPEETYLYRFLSGREVIDFYGRLFQIERRGRRRRTDELLEMVGLGSAARRPVGEYSKGMARRIGLAQALINDPDLLILDEPTSGLDPIGSKLVKDVILRLGRDYGKTILLSSHLLSDVEEVCQRVAILYGGVTRAEGSLRELLSRADMTQLTVEKLSPETIREVVEVIRRREGKDARVAVPTDRLETLFLRIVEQARTMRVETAGAVAAGELAGFLGDDGQARAVLAALQRVEPVAAEPAAPAATPQQPARAVLAELSTPLRAPPAAEPQPAAQKIDDALLKDLLGDDTAEPKR